MKNLLKGTSKLSIFGTGDYARRLYELLDDNQKNRIDCFIVSDNYKIIDSFFDKPVITLSKYSEDYSTDSNVLVAVANNNINEITGLLSLREIKYYVLNENDFKSLYRNKHKVSSDLFLRQTVPISNIYGLDRGMAIDRYYIEMFLNEYCKGKNINCVLEVAENTYSKKYFPNAKHEILDFEKGMDLTKEGSIKDNYYDAFICTQTYNVIYDVKKAITGSYNLLKKGGILFATVAGNICQVSKYDMDRWGDYWRFTYRSIKMLIEESFGSNVQVLSYGNAMAATSFIQGLCVEDVNTDLLDETDPDYSILIGIIARK